MKDDYNSTFLNSTDVQSDAEKPGPKFMSIFHIIIITVVGVHLLYLLYMLVYQWIRKRNLANKDGPESKIRKINETCSICLDDISWEVQLICSHSYCASCLIEYGKQRFSMVDILCPICRKESKFIFPQFERDTENKELYDQVINYNHEAAGDYKTSYVLIIDICRLSFYYLRQLVNVNNPRFARHRAIIILVLLICFIAIIMHFNWSNSDSMSAVEDLFYYIFLVIYLGAKFYRGFRAQTNSEFYRINSVPDIQPEGVQDNSEESADHPSVNNQV